MLCVSPLYIVYAVFSIVQLSLTADSCEETAGDTWSIEGSVRVNLGMLVI